MEGCGEPVADSCKHNNEPSGSIKCWEFPEYVSNYEVPEKDPGT
jgi:hypothetical protein